MHPGVDKVSFTGGNAVGAEVMRLAALSAKNVTLELGGKSSIIVFDDADLETAVDAIMAGIFFNCGQMCSATSRLVIHQDVGEAVKQVLLDRVAKLKIVGSDDLASDMGPITTRRQFDKVCAYFSTASKENLHVLHGGRSLEADGFFVEPTIYWDVPTSSRLWREEIFGPVLCVRTFDSEQEAISIAEDTEYGLAATLCGQDTERLARVSNKLRAGHIWWNAEQFVPVESSWGGFKSSGIGRELGLHGLRSFQEVKQITRPIKRASTSIA
jgi:betaine-aldehyde dehydrogenase